MSRRKFIAAYQRQRLTDREELNALRNNQNIRGMPIGVIVATRNNEGKVSFGHAMCHPDDQNHFSKKRAIDIALTRAVDNGFRPIPHGLKSTVNSEFLKRCETYFKEEGLEVLLDDGKTTNSFNVVTSHGVNSICESDFESSNN